MDTATTLGQAVRALDDRRRAIEAAILADLELHLLAEPAPAGELTTDVIAPVGTEPGTGNASPSRTVTWQD